MSPDKKIIPDKEHLQKTKKRLKDVASVIGILILIVEFLLNWKDRSED